MTFLVTGQDAKIAAWVDSKIAPAGNGFGPCTAIGMASPDRTKLWGGVVYHTYVADHGTMFVSSASVYPRWAPPSTIRALLSYPFDQLGVRKLMATIAADNARSLRLCKGLGFTAEATLRHQFGQGKHAVVLSMMDYEYRRKWVVEMKEAA